MMKSTLKQFNRVNSLIEGLYHEAAVKMDMTDCEQIIFYVLVIEGDGCNQSLLYKQTGLPKSTVNSAVRKLEKEEAIYLKREGRDTKVYLKKTGNERLSKVKKLIRIESRILESWSETERDLFIALNSRYAEQLKKELEKL